MAEYSRLFLHFLHALAENGRRVHAFVFATRLTNITRELTDRDPDEALARAASLVRIGRAARASPPALHEFNRRWSRRVLRQGAVVLLFTDGLERQVDPDLAFEMDRLQRSCRQLVWLNPLLRFDAFEARASGIRAMLPHVDDSARSTASPRWRGSAGPCPTPGQSGPIPVGGCARPEA